MIDSEGPALSVQAMTPEERFEELAAILARGCLRAMRDLPSPSRNDMEAGGPNDVRLPDFPAPSALE